MIRHGLKFAVVREDAALESRLVREHGCARVLVVASGGCTALSLLAEHPSIEVTAFDLNPLQLDHVRAKAAGAPAGELNECGEFEGLFQTLRRMFTSFIAPPEEVERFFLTADSGERDRLVASWLAHRYWPAIFASCFADGLLHAMFGPAATQNARPGSYPEYFRVAFERGLLRPDAQRNPFLQHVFLGAYLPGDAPRYLRDRSGRVPELVLGGLESVPELGRFDLYSLSNVFDWSDDALVRRWAALLADAARPGATVLIRQLNNQRDLRRPFAPAFRFDDGLGAELLAADRSLFYNRIEVGRRV